MNTQQIENLLGGLDGFLGVFPSDGIPTMSPSNTPQCLIINLDPSHKPGSHWVAACLIRRKKKNVLEFFDSYGLKPPAILSKEWIMFYNPFRFQKPKTNVCGQYCIFFVLQRLKKVSFNSIITHLKAQHSPDNFVRTYVESLERWGQENPRGSLPTRIHHQAGSQWKQKWTGRNCQTCRVAKKNEVCHRECLWNFTA